MYLPNGSYFVEWESGRTDSVYVYTGGAIRIYDEDTGQYGPSHAWPTAGPLGLVSMLEERYE